jgi:hypothetical protein
MRIYILLYSADIWIRQRWNLVFNTINLCGMYHSCLAIHRLCISGILIQGKSSIKYGAGWAQMFLPGIKLFLSNLLHVTLLSWLLQLSNGLFFFFQVICLPVCCSQVSDLPNLSLSNFDLCLLMHKAKIQGKGQYNHNSSDTCSCVEIRCTKITSYTRKKPHFRFRRFLVYMPYSVKFL